MTKARAVLFDFGGVLADEGFHEALYALADRQELDRNEVLEICGDAIYGSGYIVGRGTEADFWRLFRARLDFPDPVDSLRADILSRFRLRPSMIALVRSLRSQGLHCALLSDQVDWLDLLDVRDGFFREFDRLYISYRLGKGKRDPSLFDDVVADLGMPGASVVFVDDNVGNIERARSRALQAWLFTSERECLSRFTALLSSPLERAARTN